MKSHLKLLSVLAVIAYLFAGPGSASAQMQWTVVSPPATSNNLTSITYGNGQYVAVGDNGTILTSPDGQTWTSQVSGTSNNLLSVTYGNGQYLAVSPCQNLKNSLKIAYYWWVPTLTSRDGTTWTGNTCSTNGPMAGNSTVSYCNGQYVLVLQVGSGSSGMIFTSSDGSTWNFCKGGLFMFYSVTFGNSQYVAVGTGQYYPGWATIDISSDCISWFGDTSGASNSSTLNFVTNVNGQFVAVGTSGSVLTSSSGTTWTNQASGTSNNLNSVTYSSGQYVTVGSGGAILNSPDGINWAIDSSGTVHNLNSVATDGSGRYVVVGDSSTILISSSTAVKPVQTTPLLASVLTVQARNSLLTISLPSSMLYKAVDLAVYSVSGREIMRTRVNSSAGKFTVPVNLSYGSYILVANDGIRKASIRFVAVR
jgi:photosystem II stability/assembly factor-like uncharacterized protein